MATPERRYGPGAGITLGGIIVIVGILVLILWSTILGIILILLGLRFGFATPTEMAVLSVIYSLLLSLLLYRDLSWARFKESMIEAGIATGVVMLVIMGSAVVGWILTFGQVPTVVWAHITAVPGILLFMDEDNIVVAVRVSVMPAIAAIFTFVVVAFVATATAVDLFDPALVVVVFLSARFTTRNLAIFGDGRALD